RIASQTGAALKKEKKVKLTISPDNLGEYWEGGINGHFFRIRTGEELELPTSLAELISQSARVKMEAKKLTAAYKGNGKKIG
ncbi:hypothetical protein LJC42_08815, partial [Eubacteriales bacterium OttesenSCG-928-K08]|nr:hypothetical protein [Eubacteriales bacterium OttesenSCG-928-K08]